MTAIVRLGSVSTYLTVAVKGLEVNLTLDVLTVIAIMDIWKPHHLRQHPIPGDSFQ